MVKSGILSLLLSACLAPLLVVLAFPAAADIDLSILRQNANSAPVVGATQKPTVVGAVAEQESPQDWYRKAAALDRPDANSADLASAAYWYRRAAEQGDTDAQTNLAAMYAEGRGVALDALEAARWYRRAAEAGNVRAQYNLALMYHLGQGVSKDYADAIHWYESAARQGDANAMNNMAFMYGMGEGVEQSNVEAYVWFALAASKGNADAAENRDLAASEMTPEERRQAVARYTKLQEQFGL